MEYIDLLKYFLSTSVITGGIIYLAKIIFDKFMESRVEKYKADLQNDTDSFRHSLNLEVEKFRHTLNTSSIEHQIKYAKLYEERGLVVKLTYKYLLELEMSLSELTTLFQGSDWKGDEERDKKATKSIYRLRNHLEENRIYFSPELCDKIEVILNESHKIVVDMYVVRRKEQRNDSYERRGIELTEEQLHEPFEKWTALDEKVKNNIRSTMLELAQEFRVIIGVS